ncbi:FecR domain-containing protein [Haloferula sargassicola]|uniref:FecR protein domain-containing protein n=1 Tax=Haloferula sargassicola TaxID=490096 RepID=A0ABP9UXC4_9BACT
MKGRDETEQLIHELVDGSIEPEDFARLQEILRTDREARQKYYALTCTDQLLCERFESSELAFARHASRHRWSEKRQHGHPWAWSLSVAALVMLVGFLALFLISSPTPPVPLTVSPDASFLIDGHRPAELEWKISERLDAQSGVVAARINASTTLCLESPASVILLDDQGSFELLNGRAWVETQGSAPDFLTKLRGATIRHLGTRFGVLADQDKVGEVHVEEGKVSLERPNEAPVILVDGEASRWSFQRPPHPVECNAAGFQHSLPSESILFLDDFNEPAGTLLRSKEPDVGNYWLPLKEKTPTRVGGGLLDTSGGYRHLSASFRTRHFGDGRHLFLVTVTTTPPSRLSDKTSRLGGSEGIRLWDDSGSSLCSLVALAKDGHRWRLRDEVTGKESGSLDLSALEAHQLTLCFEPDSGRLSLYEGATAQGKQLARIPCKAANYPVSLTVDNDDGGDLALTRLKVTSVSYPRRKDSASDANSSGANDMEHEGD